MVIHFSYVQKKDFSSSPIEAIILYVGVYMNEKT